MARNRGSKSDGGSWTEAQIEAVWQKAPVSTQYPDYRQDACKVWMKRGKHGAQEQYGWEIDHIQPVSKGGTDDLSNLQPLFWENNQYKADTWPDWACKIRG